ncbi:PRC-barrel domain-containing protein [Nocardia sp. NPDC005978]|uniref:PRC-barrel domain-containing protein n=1 Tax=unclassified Nocardia TaxID=2637762 RepID=UPI00339F396D
MAKTLESLIGCTVRDAAGAEIGHVEGFYLDNESGIATWAAVSTGMGGEQALAPLEGAEYQPVDNSLRVRVDREQVRGAPHLEHDGQLEPQDERELITYYRGGQRRGVATTKAQRIRRRADEPLTRGRTGAEDLPIADERLVIEGEQITRGAPRTEYVETERVWLEENDGRA